MPSIHSRPQPVTVKVIEVSDDDDPPKAAAPCMNGRKRRAPNVQYCDLTRDSVSPASLHGNGIIRRNTACEARPHEFPRKTSANAVLDDPRSSSFHTSRHGTFSNSSQPAPKRPNQERVHATSMSFGHQPSKRHDSKAAALGALDSFTSRHEKPTITQQPAANGIVTYDTEPALCKEQADLVEVIARGRNVFYTGSAGCGKSTVLKAFVKRLKSQGKEVKIIAPTGRAALDIGGSTFWTYAGWTPNSMKHPLAKLIGNAQGRWIKKRLNDTDVLVIDEVSMIENQHFERLNQILKYARGKPDEPFGGLQLVVTGDFCQLPPVKPFQCCITCGRETLKVANDTEYKCAQHGVYYDTEKWAFSSKAWEECDFYHCHLTQIHRQSDQVFIQILQKLRMGGRLSADDRKVLLDHPCDTTDAVKLFPTTAEVKRTNDVELAKLKTEPRVYDCLDHFHWQQENHPHLRFKNNRLANGSLEALREHRLDARVELKVGMLVVLLVNLSFENGLVNGSQGRVTKFKKCAPNELPTSLATLGEKQKAKDPRDIIVPPGVQTLVGEYASLREIQIQNFIAKTRVEEWPVVKFDNGVEITVFADCRPVALGDEPEYSLLMRTQIPLVCGWAMTVHKAQGMTLNRVEVDLAKNFEQGMAYVALSRARSLEGLKVESLGESMPGNEQVKEFLEDRCGFKV